MSQSILEVESGCPYFLNNNRIICIFTGSVFVIQPNRLYLHVGKIRSWYLYPIGSYVCSEWLITINCYPMILLCKVRKNWLGLNKNKSIRFLKWKMRVLSISLFVVRCFFLVFPFSLKMVVENCNDKSFSNSEKLKTDRIFFFGFFWIRFGFLEWWIWC